MSEKSQVLIHPLESRQLNVLEKRRAGRQTRRVKKRRIENPVSCRRTINICATFERAIIIVRIEKIDQ